MLNLGIERYSLIKKNCIIKIRTFWYVYPTEIFYVVYLLLLPNFKPVSGNFKSICLCSSVCLECRLNSNLTLNNTPFNHSLSWKMHYVGFILPQKLLNLDKIIDKVIVGLHDNIFWPVLFWYSQSTPHMETIFNLLNNIVDK